MNTIKNEELFMFDFEDLRLPGRDQPEHSAAYRILVD